MSANEFHTLHLIVSSDNGENEIAYMDYDDNTTFKDLSRFLSTLGPSKDIKVDLRDGDSLLSARILLIFSVRKIYRPL